jgi:hypothetical protein
MQSPDEWYKSVSAGFVPLERILSSNAWQEVDVCFCAAAAHHHQVLCDFIVSDDGSLCPRGEKRLVDMCCQCM